MLIVFIAPLLQTLEWTKEDDGGGISLFFMLCPCTAMSEVLDLSIFDGIAPSLLTFHFLWRIDKQKTEIGTGTI